ncbi:hypothetical protein MJO28_002394 [Puccinia striiformis f. sp. tritici]|uniref:Uncharacterized protein n=1 Tax=Puccinia striiformis f. sp. tritici TaxID=168172 RepID=A0ACC0EW66_9BASI|nr:hypothetical protein MJO28_002394 [Puccinia striiformis f. sp. tritici]
MKKTVKKWVQSCDACQKRSSAQPWEEKKATGSPVVFGRVSLDTVHIKAGKWKYLVVARGDLSGWVEAVGLEKIQAKKIAQWFQENWIFRFGAPWTVTVDGGSEFGKQFQEALTTAGIKVRVTTAYYPEANGMIERGHQALKDTLVKLCGTDGKKWRSYLPLVLFADRISTKRTTGYSPYELILGQSPILPVDLELETYLGIDWHKVKTTQDTAEVPPDPAGSSTSASLTLTGLGVAPTPLLLISAGQGADTATSISSSTGPRILINPASSSSTAPHVNPSSLSQPGSNSTGPVGVTNHPNGLAPPPPGIIILKLASSADPNANPAATSDPNTTPSTPPPPPSIPILVLNNSVRAKVHTILETFQGHPHRQKFNQAYLAVHAFIDCQAKTMHKRTPPPELPQFALVQSESSHSAWLKDTQKYSDLAALKTQGHVEYPLALLLVEIQKPSKFILSQWSNCIASSIQLTAQDHAVKPPSLSDLNNNNLDSHLRILEYLNSCKTSASPSNPEDGKLRNDMTLKPLYQLHDLITDIFITYSIIRGSAVADVEPDTTSAESQALVLQKKELDKHCS